MKHFLIIIFLLIFPVLAYSQCNYSFGRWESTLSSMPVARSSCSALAYHDSIYVLGGLCNMAAPENVSPVDVYDPLTDTWVAGITEFPFPRGCSNACLIGDKIYAFGGARISGESVTAFDSLHIYDIPSNSWERGKCLPVEMGYFAADTLNGKIYVAGGGGSGYSIFNSLYEYDPVLDEWTEKAPMSTSRWGTFARSWKGKLYVFGGYAGNDWTISRTIEVYDPGTDEWTKLTSAITPRTSGSMFLLDGQLYVIGGYHNPSATSYNHTRIISRYDIATDTWFDFFHPEDNLPDGRRFSANAMLDDTFYFLGGGGDEDIMDQIWSYTLKDIRQDRIITDTLLGSESIEIDLSAYFSSTGEEEISYAVCPDYNEELIGVSIENSILRIERLDQAGTTDITVNVFDTKDTISSNTFSVANPVGIQSHDVQRLSVHPNPASVTTAIRYSTAEAGTVSLEVYNPLGQLVESIHMQNIAAGDHQFEWNVEGYQGGIYLMVMKTGSSVLVGKLMIKH